MSVVVRVALCDQPPLNVIEIKRITNVHAVTLDPDAVSQYQVIDYARHDHIPPVIVEHRYGDPMNDLVIQALTALKQQKENHEH